MEGKGQRFLGLEECKKNLKKGRKVLANLHLLVGVLSVHQNAVGLNPGQDTLPRLWI